jgi:hypothetical protein
VTVSGNYPTESIFGFCKPSVGRSVGNNLFCFHPYSDITPEAAMVMKKASGGDSPLRQGAGKSFWILPISHRRRRRLTVGFVEN